MDAQAAWIRLARALVAGLLCATLALALGCRKSKQQQEQQEAKEKAALKAKREQIEAREDVGTDEYKQAKEMVKRGQYEEGWQKLQELAEQDAQVKWKLDLYKKTELPNELFRQADQLSGVQVENFQAAVQRLEWVKANIEGKREQAEKKRLEVMKKYYASRTYKEGLNLIDRYQRAHGIAKLEEVRDKYSDTVYAEMAEAKLRELNPPPVSPQ